MGAARLPACALRVGCCVCVLMCLCLEAACMTSMLLDSVVCMLGLANYSHQPGVCRSRSCLSNQQLQHQIVSCCLPSILQRVCTPSPASPACPY